jgi:hypothetical protein
MKHFGLHSTRARIVLLLGMMLLSGNPAFALELSELSLSYLQPYTAEFEFYIENENGELEKAGTWSDLLTIENGQLTRKVERFTLYGDTDLVRTVIVNLETLAPVRIQQRFGPDLANTYQVEFNDGSITQVLIGAPSAPARISNSELVGTFVETGLQAVFTLSLPFEDEEEVIVKSYTAGAEPTVVSKSFHIVGQEKMKVLGQDLMAWRIEDRAARWTYWVRKDKPYILKIVHPVPGGKMATSIPTSFK